jgi:hypothetical protein
MKRLTVYSSFMACVLYLLVSIAAVAHAHEHAGESHRHGESGTECSLCILVKNLPVGTPDVVVEELLVELLASAQPGYSEVLLSELKITGIGARAPPQAVRQFQS